jgi:hypothetical protein
MPSHFASASFQPGPVKTMGDAFERAWGDFERRPKNKGLARSLMASAITEAIEAGNRDCDVLVRKATVTLTDGGDQGRSRSA